jgi:hypothetical protein
MEKREINWKKRMNILVILLLVGSLGVLLNIEAKQSNGGRMPVQTRLYLDSETHFNFIAKYEIEKYYLTDIIKVETDRKIHCLSIGDLLIYAGFYSLFVFVSFVFISEGYFKIKKIKERKYGIKIHN